MTYKRRPTDIHNLPQVARFRTKLRSNLTSAEARLWTLLRNSQLDGRKFRRQHSAGNYILDFYCPSERLGVELDGEDHFTPQGVAHDAERRLYLERCRIKVVRFENKRVFKDETAVLARIREELVGRRDSRNESRFAHLQMARTNKKIPLLTKEGGRGFARRGGSLPRNFLRSA
jgi:very-short-patch-repair endonuclease